MTATGGAAAASKQSDVLSAYILSPLNDRVASHFCDSFGMTPVLTPLPASLYISKAHLNTGPLPHCFCRVGAERDLCSGAED